VYVLKSEASGKFYAGLTSNIQRRLQEHNSGVNRMTRHGRPWQLIHWEECANRTEAREREKYFKSGVGREWRDRTFKGM